ncbi:MAG: conjugative transfer signal peptidase TraF [Pseudaminobacter sp.]
MTISWRRVIIVASIAALPTVMLAASYGAGIRLNLTPSYPLGLWRIEALARPVVVSDLVFVCPPETAAFALGLERGYVRRGLCPGWLSPLIKTVVALPGQHIEIDDAVMIDGRKLPQSVVRTVDAEDRALPSHPGGTVPTDHLFLHSSFAGSYDSRYFGPIPASGVLGLARPILTVVP